MRQCAGAADFDGDVVVGGGARSFGRSVKGCAGAEFDQAKRVEVRAEVKTAEDAANDRVWSGYPFVVCRMRRRRPG